MYIDWIEDGGWQVVECLIDQGVVLFDGIWCDSGFQGVGLFKYFVEYDFLVLVYIGGDFNQMYKLVLYYKVFFVVFDYLVVMGVCVIEVVFDVLLGKLVLCWVEVLVFVVLLCGMEMVSVCVDIWVECYVGWDFLDMIILFQGLVLRKLSVEVEFDLRVLYG